TSLLQRRLRCNLDASICDAEVRRSRPARARAKRETRLSILENRSMKKLTVLAAAVGLSLAATQANASLVQGSDQTTGSALFLAVWNSTTSYVRDLGINFGTVTNGTAGNVNTATGPNAAWVSNAGFTQTFAGDSLFASTFAAGGLAGLNWSLFAADASSSPTVSTNPGGFVGTFSQGPTGLNYTQILNSDGRGGTSYLANVNLAANSTNAGGCATNASCAQTSASAAYAGGASFGSNVAGSLP